MRAFAAAALAAFEPTTGRRVVEHFDLITGTSTGGIIAIGPVRVATAQEVSRPYGTEGPRIFPKRSGIISDRLAEARSMIRPQFST